MSQPPPARRKDADPPLIPTDIIDAPTQRLYLVAALVLVQAYKLSHFLSHPEPIPAGAAPLLDPNWTLWQWIAIDFVTLQVVRRLRIPRFAWGWKPTWALVVALTALDYALFGRWTFSASILLPTSIKSLVTHYSSTTERSVRLSKVVGSKGAHLGGQYTVHILAVSTAILNPLSSTYCRFAGSQASDPTLIPLLLNNTSPSKLTYSLTSLTDPESTREITVPVSQLVKPRKHHLPHHHYQQHAIKDSSDEDDDLALAAQWSLTPAHSRPNADKNLHHPLPDSSASSSASSRLSTSRDSNAEHALDSSDPLSSLSPSQSLYYLPVSTPGRVELVSIIDTDGHPIRIRRKRSPSATSPTSYESTLISHCPQAGFDLQGQDATQHRCLVDPSSFVAEETVSLGLTVHGHEPLKVQWYSRQGDPKTGFKKIETLEGIVGPTSDREARIQVPLNVSLSTSGQTHYYIDRVTDSHGNEVTYSAGGAPLLEQTVATRSVVVHRPPEVMFAGECSKGEEVQLLHGRKKKLHIRIGGLQEEEQYHAQVGLKFTPIAAPSGSHVAETGWTRQIEAKGRNVEIEVDQQGRYEIVSVQSRFCQGAVLVPNACTLILQPLPTLSTTFTPLHDLCSSPTGLLTTLHLTGVAPFSVSYTLSRIVQGRPHSTTRHVQRLSHSRDEFKLEPGPGEWEVRFTQIEDRFYKKLPLDPTREFDYVKRIKVDEVAEAKWREREKTVHSCEGATVGVDVDLKGTAPWTLEYSVVGQKPQVIEGITKSPHHVQVAIPNLVSQQGGQFALSLESVLDAHGCRRPLTSPDLVVDVRRTKPSARFHGAEGKREVVIREGDEARIPVRLTGEGPWTITYSGPTSTRPVSFTAHQPNVDLLISSAPAGTYKLLSVRDKFCPGDIVETEWNVSILERPKVGLDVQGGKKKGNMIKKEGVCQNTVDHIGMVFEGKAPFKATYTLAKNGHSHDSKVHTLQAIQPRASLTLFTADPGHHIYEITGVSDSLYTSTSSAGLVAPFKVEQEVWALPEAHFSHPAKHGFCVHDELASRSSDDLVLELAGQAPFSVELEVREEGKRGTKKFTVPDIKSHRWPVSLPYKLNTPNPHSIAVRRVVDAHGCESRFDSAPSSASSSTVAASKKSNFARLSVSETATISPVSSQVDHCVGDFLDFVVQGSPPFTVKYEFDGKKHSVPLKGSQFQRLATEEGTFRVLSVGHGEDQCRSNSVDLVKRIHPIPSAKVSTGESIVVDIREGDQTEIVFSFTGTAPFSFTYSRRAPQDRSKDKKVLETHTVTGIQENTYSILTSQEGTYSVSYIADKYCSYPPASKSGAVVR
ncbi:Pom152p [Sporobolomyces koalae]|uniref:Pom152p n=1 Tax=Sporobolomyces koalae TaxID=500713 RepID=UPI003171B5DB